VAIAVEASRDYERANAHPMASSGDSSNQSPSSGSTSCCDSGPLSFPFRGIALLT
jgi:hypothetical protein